MRIKDILAVLDSLAVKKVHYLGYSMGGWLGFAMAKHALERLHSLIIGGVGPNKQDPDPLNELIERLSGDLRLIEQGGILDPSHREMTNSVSAQAKIT